MHSGKRYTEHVNGKKHKEALAACLAHHTPSYPSLAAGRRQRRVPISSNLVSTLASALSSKKKLKGFEKGGASVMSAGSSKTLVNAEGLFALISDGFTDERKADRAYVAHLTAKIEEILRNPSVPSSSTDQNTCAENADTTSNELTTKKLASENNNGVILFYNYTHLTEAATLRDWQEELCGALGITGRTRIAKEGINGTLGTLS